MKHEFTKIKSENETRYVLETSSAGGTSTAGGATVSQALGGIRRRTKEAVKPTSTPPTVRNPVARNASAAIGGGAAGSHKNKKKAAQQVRGQKHRGQDVSEDSKNSDARMIKQKLIKLLKRINPELETNYLELATIEELRDMIDQFKHQNTSEGSILKSIKRGLQGWDKNAIGPSGEKLGDPRAVVNRAKNLSDKDIKSVHASVNRPGLGIFGKGEFKDPNPHSPAGLQKRVLDREMKKRGLGEEGVAEGDINEIDYADKLDSSSISLDNLIKAGKVIGNIEGNDVVMLSKGNQKIYILKVDDKATAFVGFDGENLKNIKNFTQTPGVIRALLGYLVHKENMKIVISPNEPLTAEGLKWIIRLINDPRGLDIKNSDGDEIDPIQLKQEWKNARKTGTPGTTGITISENRIFGNKLRENELRRNSDSLLMPFNFYSVRKNVQGVAEATGDEKFDRSMRQMTGKVTPNDAAKMWPTQEFEPINLDPSYLPTMEKYKAKLFPMAYQFWTDGDNADELRALGWEPAYGDDYVMVILSGIGHDGHIQYDKYDFDANDNEQGVAEGRDEPDHEISMASNELVGIVENAKRLLKLIQKYSEMEGLEAWQQSKITKAADYLNGVLNSLRGDAVINQEDHTGFDKGWGQSSYDTYAGGNHGRGVAEGLSWSALDKGLSLENKMAIFEEYAIRGNLTESIDQDKKDYFMSLSALVDTPIKNKKYVVVPLSLVNNKIMPLDNPAIMRYLGQNNNGLVFDTANGKKTYPSKAMRELSIFNTFTFSNQFAYDKFRTALSLKFDISLPSIDIEKGVAEGNNRDTKPGWMLRQMRGTKDNSKLHREQEVSEEKIKGVDGKACWKGKRYAGRVKKADGTYKDKCIPVGEDEFMNELFSRLENAINEKAVSKAQQRFMGMVHAAQKGEKPASSKVAKAAKGMSMKAGHDFAATKHKGLPEKKKPKK